MEGPEQPIKIESDLGATIVRVLSLATLLAVLGLLCALGWLFVVYPDSDGPAGHDEELVIEVSDGMTLRTLAKELEAEGVIERPRFGPFTCGCAASTGTFDKARSGFGYR